MGYEFDFNAVTPALKNHYTNKKIQTLAFQSALLGIFPKYTAAGGQQYVGAMRSAIGSTASHTASTSFTAGSSSVYNQWLCPWASGYASANVTGLAIDASKGDENSLVDAMVSEFDGAFIDLGQQLGAEIFGDGGGSFGQISTTSNVGTTQITLANPSQTFNFVQGQILQSSSDDGTGGAGVRTGTVTLTAVDIMNGTLTASGNWSAGITGVTAGDYLFQDGNYDGAFAGLSGWIPAYNNRTNLGTAFNNVVRSADPTRLAGVAYNGAGAPYDESMIQLAAYVQRMNGRPDYFIVNPLDYAQLEKLLGSRVQYMSVESFDNPQISFPGISFATPYGFLKILSDVYCPQGTGYMLQMNSWLLPSMGEVPRLYNGVDGLTWLRSPTDDNFQMRCLWRATVYCDAPGHNGVVTF